MSSKAPLYPRLLRLRHVHPNAWQRALLGEGALGLAAVLVLADLATAWTLLALPVAVAVVVKVHDVVAGLVRPPAPEEEAVADTEPAADTGQGGEGPVPADSDGSDRSGASTV